MQFGKAFHILNPNAVHRNSVDLFFQKHSDFESNWVDRSSHPTHLETMVDWVVQERHLEIVVWGGDGTLSRVVQRLYERDALSSVEISLIPVGTCNDFSRRIQPGSWVGLTDQALGSNGRKKKLDLGLLSWGDEKRIFVNNAGFGRVASAVREKSLNPLRDIFSFSEKHLEIDWMDQSGKKHQVGDFILGVVCNGPFFSGGLHFEKVGNPEDGVLNGYFEKPQAKFQLLLKFLRGRMGYSLANNKTLSLMGTSVTVQSRENLFPQCDGESPKINGVTQIGFSVLPQAVNFYIWN